MLTVNSVYEAITDETMESLLVTGDRLVELASLRALKAAAQPVQEKADREAALSDNLLQYGESRVSETGPDNVQVLRILF